jgi:hypothetical protein
MRDGSGEKQNSIGLNGGTIAADETASTIALRGAYRTFTFA